MADFSSPYSGNYRSKKISNFLTIRWQALFHKEKEPITTRNSRLNKT